MDKSTKPLNHRQERFCQLLATPDVNGQTRSRIDAYIAAYGTKSRVKASNCAYRLLSDPRIRARLEGLRGQEAYEQLIEQYLPFASIVANINALLADDKHPTARIAGVKLALKVRELFLPRPAAEEPSRFTLMSDEELLAEVQKLFGN